MRKAKFNNDGKCKFTSYLNYLNMGALIGRFAWGSSWRKLRRGRQSPGSPGRPRSPFRPPEPSEPLGPSGPSKPGKPGPPVLPFSPSGPIGPFENYTVKVINYWLLHEKTLPFCSHDIKKILHKVDCEILIGNT